MYQSIAALALAGACMTAVPTVHADPLPASMAGAAQALLSALDAAQKAKVQFAFDADERFNWHFTPVPRAGLPLKQMTPAQREKAFALLRVGLSEKGYTKAESIRALEPILAAIERDPVKRDPELYYVTIFGEPSVAGTWGWRYEGHHVSQNWTIVNGRSIASTPQFFGSNPAEVRDGPKKGTRVLAAEEDLARALLDSLTEAQKATAIIAADAPDDILTSNARTAGIQQDLGIAHDALSTEQRGLLMAVIDEYAAAQPRALATERLRKLRDAGLSTVKFAWMGSRARGERHYYRVQGTTFLIEYDNTQNGANHVHAVWRDFAGDWGADLLAEHYKHSAHHGHHK